MKEYVTIQGDTWDGIAFKLYGDESHMIKLMEANPTHIRTVIFSAGSMLSVPNVPPAAANDLPPWKRGE